MIATFALFAVALVIGIGVGYFARELYRPIPRVTIVPARMTLTQSIALGNAIDFLRHLQSARPDCIRIARRHAETLNELFGKDAV